MFLLGEQVVGGEAKTNRASWKPSKSIPKCTYVILLQQIHWHTKKLMLGIKKPRTKNILFAYFVL